MKRRASIAVPGAGLLCVAGIVLLTQPALSQQPSLARLVMSDSAPGPGPNGTILSPDGRWLVYSVRARDQEAQLWVRPAAGGEARRLIDLPGQFYDPQFTPKGDWLLFDSSLPQRNPADEGPYVMEAPFDTQTGTLSGPPRQVTLDPVWWAANWVISPDGRRVAYVCGSNLALRVVPIHGGSARTLFTPPPAMALAPRWLGWSADGRALTFQARETPNGPVNRYRVAPGGGEPVVAARSSAWFGQPIPSRNVFFTITQTRGDGQPSALRFKDEQGNQIGHDVVLAGLHFPENAVIMGGGGAKVTGDGRHLVVNVQPSSNSIRIVPTDGGAIRNTAETGADVWPLDWTSDSRTLWVTAGSGNGTVYRAVAVNGRPVSQARAAEGNVVGSWVVGSTIIAAERSGQSGEGITYWAINTDGSRRRLAAGVYGGGVSYTPAARRVRGSGPAGDRLYYTRRSGGRLEVRALAPSGEDRLVMQLPASLDGASMAFSEDRVAYIELRGDSVQLMVKVAGSAAVRLGTFPGEGSPGDALAWSDDGRQLAAAPGIMGEQLLVYQFDAAGRSEGAPRRISLPASYEYDMNWLPDGSGLTAIAQLPDRPWPVVALFRFADPAHPVVLTGDDPEVWEHIMSPDGKLEAYAAMEERGGSTWLVDLDAALAAARRP